jgi:hypothetical protein
MVRCVGVPCGSPTIDPLHYPKGSHLMLLCINSTKPQCGVIGVCHSAGHMISFTEIEPFESDFHCWWRLNCLKRTCREYINMHAVPVPIIPRTSTFIETSVLHLERPMLGRSLKSSGNRSRSGKDRSAPLMVDIAVNIMKLSRGDMNAQA